MEAKLDLDFGARIAQRPRAAVGIALGVGALLGLLGRRAKTVEGKSTLSGAILAALGAFAINRLKDLALREGMAMAKGWWADRTEPLGSDFSG